MKPDSLLPAETILFVCPHGSAKSVIAASYFNRLAVAAGLPNVGTAAAAEEPYQAVPPPVVEFLAREGIDVKDFRPQRVEPQQLETAARVIAIGCETAIDSGRSTADRWDDVPLVSVDLEGSRGAIRRHVESLVAELLGRE